MNLATSKFGHLWSISMSQYRPESQITGDEGVDIWDLSGCTALFFFSDTSVSAYHIEAGKEMDQVKWATNNAKTEGSPKRVVLYAPRYNDQDRAKEDLVRKIIKDNQGPTDISTNGYMVNVNDRTQRFRYWTEPPAWEVKGEEYFEGEDMPVPPEPEEMPLPPRP